MSDKTTLVKITDLKKVLADTTTVFDYDLEEDLPTGEVTPTPEKKEKFWKNTVRNLPSIPKRCKSYSRNKK